MHAAFYYHYGIILSRDVIGAVSWIFDLAEMISYMSSIETLFLRYLA